MDDYNIDKQILNELRLHTHLYRKRYIPILLIFLIFLAFFAFSGAFKYYYSKNVAQKPVQEISLTWNQVEDLFDKGKYEEAEKKALILVNNNTEDYYSHACIARIYLRKGDLTNALKHAEIAYNLFPNKDNEETLEALKKLVESKSSTPPPTKP